VRGHTGPNTLPLDTHYQKVTGHTGQHTLPFGTQYQEVTGHTGPNTLLFGTQYQEVTGHTGPNTLLFGTQYQEVTGPNTLPFGTQYQEVTGHTGPNTLPFGTHYQKVTGHTGPNTLPFGTLGYLTPPQLVRIRRANVLRNTRNISSKIISHLAQFYSEKLTDEMWLSEKVGKDTRRACNSVGDGWMSVGNYGNETYRGNSSTERKTCPCATFSSPYTDWPENEPMSPRWEAGD
jgi:hypothetical protein